MLLLRDGVGVDAVQDVRDIKPKRRKIVVDAHDARSVKNGGPRVDTDWMVLDTGKGG